jgi:lysyl-tRNA synthetase class II
MRIDELNLRGDSLRHDKVYEIGGIFRNEGMDTAQPRVHDVELYGYAI